MKTFIGVVIIIFVTLFVGCHTNTSDDVQQAQQEKILAEGTSMVSMPAIHNFREKKLLKDILELRDQDGLVTYTYVFNELNGKLIFLGQTVGYGIPYATQFTNPAKYVYTGSGPIVLPQADPRDRRRRRRPLFLVRLQAALHPCGFAHKQCRPHGDGAAR